MNECKDFICVWGVKYNEGDDVMCDGDCYGDCKCYCHYRELYQCALCGYYSNDGVCEKEG